MREMISPEEAKSLVLAEAQPTEIETCSLIEALGRPVAEKVLSTCDVAPFAHSAMDGYALRCADIAHASSEHPVSLCVLGELAAGDWSDGEVQAGQCVRIMTGAPLPQGADSVVKFEIVKADAGTAQPGTQAVFSAPTALRSNIREAGEEAKQGDIVMSTSEIVNPAGLGFLASCGVSSVRVHKKPRVAIISIGSELVDIASTPTRAQIRNSNAYALSASALEAGAVADIRPIVHDSLDDLKKEIEYCTSCYDVVVTSGGASNGDFDFIKPAIDSLGTLMMTTVNMRPGKAVAFGLVHDVPVFGLPGNPAAAYVSFEMFVRPTLRKMQGYTCLERGFVWAHLDIDVKKRDPRRIYLRARVRREGDSYYVSPAQNQSSGLFGVIQCSNCLATIPEGLESKHAGDKVKCILLGVSEDSVF